MNHQLDVLLTSDNWRRLFDITHIQFLKARNITVSIADIQTVDEWSH